MDDRLEDPDDVTEARRFAEGLAGVDWEEVVGEILEEIRGSARRRARAEYLAEGAANEGVEWYPGRWRIRPKTDS